MVSGDHIYMEEKAELSKKKIKEQEDLFKSHNISSSKNCHSMSHTEILRLKIQSFTFLFSTFYQLKTENSGHKDQFVASLSLFDSQYCQINYHKSS